MLSMEELRDILNELDATRKENEKLKAIIVGQQVALALLVPRIHDYPDAKTAILSLMAAIDQGVPQEKI